MMYVIERNNERIKRAENELADIRNSRIILNDRYWQHKREYELVCFISNLKMMNEIIQGRNSQC